MHSDQSKRIAELNDTHRRTRARCVVTPGVQALGQESMSAVLGLVAQFDAFTPDNDPYGEHDFGIVEYGGERVFWKIDYYNADLEYHSPDPADPVVTRRVLTVLLAREY